MKTSHRRRISGGAIGAAAVAAGALTATSAQANPISMTVSGIDHYVNSTYTLTIQCDFRSTVAVIDNGEVVSGTPTPPDVNNVAVAQWTPTTTGVHTLVAEGCMSHVQTNTPIQITVTVTDAVPVTPAWQLNAIYNVGDVVTYDGAKYQCRQAHTAYAPNWTPPNTPALWQKL
ncbi:carbohydrate-binding protein [Nocardia salmonicida]|uniref:carbohydrate-binding protein n=1 Tax=Nocardia salmonicida TaxID=53431 RepID=UPI0009EF622F|nr:carbohydrate-binding protein [Nocardia salmonicida]